MMFFLLLLCILLRQANSFSCLDENGFPVDSWTALKSSHNISYYYYNALAAEFQLSPYTTNQSTNGAIMLTVNQLYEYSIDLDFVAYGMYSDQPPAPSSTPSSSYAHSKGLLLTNGCMLVFPLYLSPLCLSYAINDC